MSIDEYTNPEAAVALGAFELYPFVVNMHTHHSLSTLPITYESIACSIQFIPFITTVVPYVLYNRTKMIVNTFPSYIPREAPHVSVLIKQKCVHQLSSESEIAITSCSFFLLLVLVCACGSVWLSLLLLLLQSWVWQESACERECVHG
jgi:hypothetical protein